MTIQALLCEIRRLRGDIGKLERQRELMGGRAKRAGASVANLYGGGSPRHCNHEIAVLEAWNIDADLAELGISLEACLRLLRPHLDWMGAGPERAAARLWYLEGMSASMIAAQMHYARPYVYELIGKANQIMASNAAAQQTDIT